MSEARNTWDVFSAAPHRLFFWGGASYSVIVVLLWSLQQTSLHTRILPAFFWELPNRQAHGFMMIYGIFGFYFFGFLLTTFPRWLDLEPIPKRVYLNSWYFILTGAHLFWIGLFFGKYISLIACILMLAGFLLATSHCFLWLFRSSAQSKYQQYFICLGLSGGILGILLFSMGIFTGAPVFYLASRQVGIYLFLLPVIFSVIHRMVPFFTHVVSPDYASKRWPPALFIYFILFSIRAILGFLGFNEWVWIPDGIVLILLSVEVYIWQPGSAQFQPLLTILYVALAWIWLSLALSTGEGIYMLVTDSPIHPFGNAPLHALTVGGFGSFLIGISTRVTLGHSGRGLATNRLIAALFWIFQLVPILRVGPEILGFWMKPLAQQVYWSGFLWSAVFGVWFVAFAPTLMKPRSDGRPG